jgi:hypothetical protein
LVILGCTALAALCFIACGGYGEEKTVKIVVTGADDAKYDEISEQLKDLKDSDSSGHMTSRIGNTFTLAPVTDLQAFADKIDFGKVTNVDEATRTVSVTVGEAEPAPGEPTPVKPSEDGAGDSSGSPATTDEAAGTN